jgi:hypothetical protein
MNGEIPVSSNLKLGYHMDEKTRYTSKWPESSEGPGSRLVHPALELNAVPEPIWLLPLPLVCHALAKGHTLADPREDALGLRMFFDGRLWVEGEDQYLIEARHDCPAWRPDGVKWLP